MKKEDFLEGVAFLEKYYGTKITAGQAEFWKAQLDHVDSEVFFGACGNYSTKNKFFPTLAGIQAEIEALRRIVIEKENEKSRAEEERYRHTSLADIGTRSNVPPKVKRLWTIIRNGGTRQEYLDALRVAGYADKKTSLGGSKMTLEEFYQAKGLPLNEPMGLKFRSESY